MSTKQAGLSAYLALYLFVAVAYFMPAASWNPASHFALTRALVENHSFEITPFAESTGDRAKVGERTFSDKAPLPSFLAVPAYFVCHAVLSARDREPSFEALGPEAHPENRVHVNGAYRVGLWVSSLSTSGLAATLIGVLLFELLRRRTGEQAATAGAIAGVLGTPIYLYGTTFFGHTIAAAFLLGAFAIVVLTTAHASPRLALAGALLAAAVASEYIAIFPAAVLGVFFISRAKRRIKTLALLFAGALIPLALLALYHSICFGAPWRTGYTFVTLPIFARGHAAGFMGFTRPSLAALWGLSFGRARGLFYLAPVSLVGALALVVAWYRKRDRALGIALVCVLVLLLANASYYMWNGGWAAGPRHWVPALGFLGLGIGLAFSWPKWRPVALLFACVSVWIMLMTIAVGIEAPPDEDALFGYLLPAVRRGSVARVPGASNLGLELGLSRKWSAFPALIWVAAGAWYLTRSRSNAPNTKESRQLSQKT